MFIDRKFKTLAAAVVVVSFAALPALAATIDWQQNMVANQTQSSDGFATYAGSFQGNECQPGTVDAGAYTIERLRGTPFTACELHDIYAEIRTPVIAKINRDDPGGDELNTTDFPNLTYDMFDVFFDGDRIANIDYNTVVGLEGVMLTHVSIKAGQTVDLWRINNPFLIGSFTVDYRDAGEGRGISHVTFWDTPAAIPLPAAGWLLLTALGGLGAAGLRRRRKDA